MLRLVILGAVIVVIGLLVRAAERHVAFFPLAGGDEDASRAGLPVTAVDVRTADGETLRAWWIPARRPVAQVVYFHGNGGNLTVWRPILAGLHERGLSVFAVDYRGYGRSTGSPSERGLYRDVEATVERFAADLRSGDSPVIYWGRSLGACMAAYAASKAPPDGVVLESGFPDVRTLLRSNPVMWLLSWISTYRFPAARWMADVDAPTLVIHGTSDSVIPFRAGEALFARIGEPKRFLRVEGGDHNDVQPPDPEAYWRGILDFMRSLTLERS